MTEDFIETMKCVQMNKLMQTDLKMTKKTPKKINK